MCWHRPIKRQFCTWLECCDGCACTTILYIEQNCCQRKRSNEFQLWNLSSNYVLPNDCKVKTISPLHELKLSQHNDPYLKCFSKLLLFDWLFFKEQKKKAKRVLLKIFYGSTELKWEKNKTKMTKILALCLIMWPFDWAASMAGACFWLIICHSFLKIVPAHQNNMVFKHGPKPWHNNQQLEFIDTICLLFLLTTLNQSGIWSL